MSSHGEVHEFPGPVAFLYWDPLEPDGILVAPLEGSAIKAFRLGTEELEPAGSWRVHDTVALFSLDGTKIGSIPMHSWRRPWPTRFTVLDRASGDTEAVRHRAWYPHGWSPDGDLIGSLPDAEGLFLLSTGSQRPRPLFDPSDLRDVLPPWADGLYPDVLSWSPNGRYFAARIAIGGESPRGGILIGTESGKLETFVRAGKRWVETPTWSPRGDEVAFIVRGGGRKGHKRAHLTVYDVDTDRRTLVARHISDVWWASWSPDGEWLLVDDWTRNRWVFLARGGSDRIRYPRLGDNPIWCCPSSPPIGFNEGVC